MAGCQRRITVRWAVFKRVSSVSSFLDFACSFALSSTFVGKNVDYLENGTEDRHRVRQIDREFHLVEDEIKQKNWYSIFPIDNYDLMYGDWEKDIIIDPDVSVQPFLPRRRHSATVHPEYSEHGACSRATRIDPR